MASIRKRQSMSDVFKGIASGITGIYVFFILTIFPFIISIRHNIHIIRLPESIKFANSNKEIFIGV